MYRSLFLLTLLFFSFSASSTYWWNVTSTTDGNNVGFVCYGGSALYCKGVFPETYEGYSQSSNSYKVSTYEIGQRYRNCTYSSCPSAYYFATVERVDACSSEEACFQVASGLCEQVGDKINDYSYTSPGNFSYGCEPYVSPQDECLETNTLQCANNFGLSSSTYTDNGDGTSSCSGVCTDGTNTEDLQDCSVYPFCDVADSGDGLDLDFTGNSGSSVEEPTLPSSESTVDNGYIPDDTSSTENPFNQAQGDKLIVEVIEAKNQNTEVLGLVSKTTNQTIVEKSDDISTTVSNSANGIIDAIESIETGSTSTFDDSAMLSAIDDLKESTQFISGLDNPDFASYSSLFGETSEDSIKSKTTLVKADIATEIAAFKSDLMSGITFTPATNGYQANSLDLGKWGSYDIGMARFAEFFGGVGNVVYMLAALTSLFIVLGGVKL